MTDPAAAPADGPDDSTAKPEEGVDQPADQATDRSDRTPTTAIKLAAALVAIEAVGVPETFELCAKLVRPGGHVANVGVHGKPATLHLEKLWIRNVTITTGLVDTSSTPTLLRMVAAGRIDGERFITHRFALDEMEQAYQVFENAGDTGALKVVLTR